MDLEWLRKRENVSSIEFGTMDVKAAKAARTDTDVQALLPRGVPDQIRDCTRARDLLAFSSVWWS